MFKKILLQSFLSLSITFTAYAAEKETVEVQNIPLPALRNDLRLRPYVDCLIGSDVVLRPLFPDDHPHFRPIFTDANAMKYFGNGQVLSPLEIEERARRQAEKNKKYYGETKTFSILKAQEMIQNRDYYVWTLITHSKVAGFGIAGRISIVIPNETELMGELAYCIAPTFGGRGLTTQGSQLVLESMPIDFMATVDPKNVGSRKVLEKLGFTPDEARKGVKKYGKTRDYYLLLKNKRSKNKLP